MLQRDCFSSRFFFILLVQIRINAVYNLVYYNRVLVYIDIDVLVESTSPFSFEGSGS